MSTTGDNSNDFMEILPSNSEEESEPEVLMEVQSKKKKGKDRGKAKNQDESKGKRKKPSTAWDHFSEIPGDSNYAKCLYCNAKISCSAANGTNAMKRHTMRCKKTPFFIDKRQTILDFESKTRVNTDGTVETVSVPKLWRFNQDEIRKAIAEMIIIDELPFSFVEREGFSKLCKVAIPDFILVSCATITRDCYGLFIENRKKLKSFFKNLTSRVCLTSDTWTSGQNLSYMCLTAHFIDDNWNLHKKIINFCPIAGHSGELIGRAVEKCLLECGLKRVLTLTVDNASSNDLAIKYLKEVINLWDDCVLNAELLHMRCAAHILNLVVKDGLKEVDKAIVKVRAAVKWVRSSPARLQKFNACILEENLSCKGLVSLDIETRWNSTYNMLKTALIFRKAFKNLKTKFSPYVRELEKVGGAPDDADWDRVAVFLPFLEIFYDATLSLSGSRYVTCNAVVEQIYDIGYAINAHLSDQDKGLREMAQLMKGKYDKYWTNVNNVNILMFIALVLDPRLKLKYVEWIVQRSYDYINSISMCERIRDTLVKLFDFYASSQPAKKIGSCSRVTNDNIGIDTTEVEGKRSKRSRLRKEYVNETGKFTSEVTTELDKYLGSECEDNDDDEFNILSWWSGQGKTYPILISMARDVLAIPVSSVASESAFSTGGRVLDQFRTSLTPRMVEALICCQDWIRSSQGPICIEESLLELESIEEG
ncbi:unnamed protein product [Amaranthus hypochondriacus]